jgi:hypothetical protein
MEKNKLNEEITKMRKMMGLTEYGEDSGAQDMTWNRHKDSGLGASQDQRMMSPMNVALHIEPELPEQYNDIMVGTAVDKYIEDAAINTEVANRYMRDDDWWDTLYGNIYEIKQKQKENLGEENTEFNFEKAAIESASGDKVVQREFDDFDRPLYFSLTDDNVNYFIGDGDNGKIIIKYNAKTGERYPIGDLKSYDEPKTEG